MLWFLFLFFLWLLDFVVITTFLLFFFCWSFPFHISVKRQFISIEMVPRHVLLGGAWGAVDNWLVVSFIPLKVRRTFGKKKKKKLGRISSNAPWRRLLLGPVIVEQMSHWQSGVTTGCFSGRCSRRANVCACLAGRRLVWDKRYPSVRLVHLI